MITPAGSECRHYYEDFNRGREIQQCRLARINPESLPWRPRDCSNCPVPNILRANSSPDMILTLTIKRGFLGLGRRLQVTAFCQKHRLAIAEPPVGCSQCSMDRPGFSDLFREGEL